MKSKHISLITLLLILSSMAKERGRDLYLEFANEDKGALTPISEFLFGEDHSDGHLTQALYLSYTHSLKRNQKLEISLEQDVFTPDDKYAESSEYGDRPFAGYLGVGGDFIVKTDEKNLNSFLNFDLIHRVSLDLGVTGPPSGAQKFQNWAHDKKGVPSYSGWDDQVEFRFGTTAAYRIITRFRRELKYIDLELSPHGVFSISNVVGYQGVGATFRLGKDLQSDYNPVIFSPLSNGNECLTDVQKFSWNLFYGIEGRHIFNNYLLEGTTSVTNRQTVSLEEFVADMQVGLILNFAHVSTAVSITNRTKEFKGQDHNQQFMRLGINVSF